MFTWSCNAQYNIFDNDIVFNIELLSCKVISVSHCDVRSGSGSCFIPRVVLSEGTIAGKRDMIKPQFAFSNNKFITKKVCLTNC